jgi:hypothetical protein
METISSPVSSFLDRGAMVAVFRCAVVWWVGGAMLVREGAQEGSKTALGGLARAYVTGKAPTLASEVPCSRAVQRRLWALRSKTSPTFFGGLDALHARIASPRTLHAVPGCASLVTLQQRAPCAKLLVTIRALHDALPAFGFI